MKNKQQSSSSSSSPHMARMLNAVLHKINPAGNDWEIQVFSEMQGLKIVLETLRNDLGAIAAADIAHDHVPTATDELDAVVNMTEEAANNIMNVCDNIQRDIAAFGPQERAVMQAHMVQIFEACTFQDITSQRISKAVKALKTIDGKVQQMLHILQQHIIEDVTPQASAVVMQSGADDTLLNGPQLPGFGVSQEEVDRILQEVEPS